MSCRQVWAVRLVGPVLLALAVVVGSVAPASAAPTTVASQVRRLAATAGHDLRKAPARTGERRALKIPGDDETYVEIIPGCAVGTGKAKVNALVFTSTKVKLDYVLTGSGLRKTGTVKTKPDRAVSAKLPSVRQGSYRLTFALHGETELVADETFDVLHCVGVQASCRAVTFTNPADNPAAYVIYQGHKKSQEFDLELAAGQSRTVRADYSTIDYDTLTADAEHYSALGHGTVKVKQTCSHGPAQPADHAVQTTALVGCSGAGPATVALEWSVQPSVTHPRWEVLDAQQRVLEGSFQGGDHGQDVSLAAGSYTYRSYANGFVLPFEDVSFDVLACVQVTPRCQAIEVLNPNAVPVVVSVLTTDDPGEDDDVEPVTVGAGATVTIPWHSASAWVLAFPDDGSFDSLSHFLSLASPWPLDDDPEEIVVPQKNC